MWFRFWRSRNRFTIDDLEYWTYQLQKVQIVNEANKDFVIEALRSIAELVTYGDQHDPYFFEFFMEKQLMGEFVRILNISRVMSVPLQLLQTISIMIQNLGSEHAIYYIFSNEHINSLITYSFDFQNEELLSYYISFLRAISGKLNKNIISLFVKTINEEVVSFPLYTEAIHYAFHEENMVRIAVRALTLNVYHVADEKVNRYVLRSPVSDYFPKMVSYLKKQCMYLDKCVSEAAMNPDASHSSSCISTAVDEIEDNLYYFSDVISSGIPELGRLITGNVLEILVFPLLLPSLREHYDESKVGVTTSLYLHCCILRILKMKDLASSIATALFCSPEYFIPKCKAKLSGCISNYCLDEEQHKDYSHDVNGGKESKIPEMKSPNSSSVSLPFCSLTQGSKDSLISMREVLLSYIVSGCERELFGSLSLLCTLLQTKELDESMLDGLGILPQRKQHKKILLQALVGEGSGEEQLLSSENFCDKDFMNSELGQYLQKFKAHYGLLFCCGKSGVSPQSHRCQGNTVRLKKEEEGTFELPLANYNAVIQFFRHEAIIEVLDVLVHLFCRSHVSADILWAGGWLLRQLLPHTEVAFNENHLKTLKINTQLSKGRPGEVKMKLCSSSSQKYTKHQKRPDSDSHEYSVTLLFEETKGSWCDLLITILVEEWGNCKKAIEASSQYKDPKCILLSHHRVFPEGQSSLVSGERMRDTVKVFVLRHQLLILLSGGTLFDLPLQCSPTIDHVSLRAKVAGLDVLVPKPGTETKLDDAVRCMVAFERGKERHFSFLAISRGTSGWILLAEEVPFKENYGIVRIAAPLGGSQPRIDAKHPTWLHLRIRPSTLARSDTLNVDKFGKGKAKIVVDGRWTLAFRDEQLCNSAKSMVLEEMHLLCTEVKKRLRNLLNLSS